MRYFCGCVVGNFSTQNEIQLIRIYLLNLFDEQYIKMTIQSLNHFAHHRDIIYPHLEIHYEHVPLTTNLSPRSSRLW